MPNSTNLALPYIDANQNQKHVTHNTALRILDALVQIQVQSATLTAPPGSPSDGQVWIVASGATGAWLGKDLQLAAWQDGAWAFYPPRAGYQAFNIATAAAIVWNGTAWVSALGVVAINNGNWSGAQLTVANGGTGQTSLLAHGILIGEGTTAVAQVASGSGGTLLQGAASADPGFSANPTLGVAGSLSGSLTLANATSGTTKLQPQTPASGTLTLPAATDTLVGRATTDTLTNKTLAAPAISGGTLDNAVIGGTTPAAASVASLNGGPLAGFRNRIINGNFAVNQRVVSGTVTLAAAAYGHDRAKAGAAGCTYTFAAGGIDTTLTITAGTLTHVVEAANVEGGTYALSWSGTAQARIYQGSPSGSYAASPITVAGLTAATNTIVEFNTGTLGKVQLEPGLVATPFERRPLGVELALCQRYFEKSYDQAAAPGSTTASPGTVALFITGLASGTYTSGITTSFKVAKRADPTVTLYSITTGAPGKVRDTVNSADVTGNVVSIGEGNFVWYGTNSAAATSFNFQMHWTATAEL